MSYRTRLLASLVAAGVLTLLLVIASVYNTPLAPAWLNLGQNSRVAAELGSGPPQHPMPRRETMGYETKEMLPLTHRMQRRWNTNSPTTTESSSKSTATVRCVYWGRSYRWTLFVLCWGTNNTTASRL